MTSDHGFPQGEPHLNNAIATREHAVILQWAARHHAEPATGQAIQAGPVALDARDGGTGIRFNFPGFAPFRPISWAQWFDHFDQCALTFVHEIEVPDRAHALWEAGGRRDGHSEEDWFNATRDLRDPAGGGPMARYRFV